jgi:hypothetical protein
MSINHEPSAVALARKQEQSPRHEWREYVSREVKKLPAPVRGLLFQLYDRMDFRGECWASNENLARDLDVKPRAVQNYIRIAKERGILETEQTARGRVFRATIPAASTDSNVIPIRRDVVVEDARKDTPPTVGARSPGVHAGARGVHAGAPKAGKPVELKSETGSLQSPVYKSKNESPSGFENPPASSSKVLQPTTSQTERLRVDPPPFTDSPTTENGEKLDGLRDIESLRPPENQGVEDQPVCDNSHEAEKLAWLNPLELDAAEVVSPMGDISNERQPVRLAEFLGSSAHQVENSEPLVRPEPEPTVPAVKAPPDSLVKELVKNSGGDISDAEAREILGLADDRAGPSAGGVTKAADPERWQQLNELARAEAIRKIDEQRRRFASEDEPDDEIPIPW